MQSVITQVHRFNKNYLIILFAFFVAASCKRYKHFDNLEKKFFIITDDSGRKVNRLQCLDDCDSDNAFLKYTIYDNNSKLEYVQESKGGKLLNSVSIGYCGDSIDKRYVSGFYIFKEYFDNSILSSTRNSERVFKEIYQLDTTKRLFFKFVDSVTSVNFSIKLDSCEKENLLLYIK